MLIKEYRIPLPLSVEEYRIAQLYMIQKKSRLDSTGEGSGVEIIHNHPYENGPGGSGQYTKKIYHIGNHIPGWLKSIVPKTALQVIEEAWNAYPYTKMRTTCPFVEKFFVDVETKYLADGGTTENVFDLSPTELSHQTTDLIDPVKDPVPTSQYSKDEDPLLYVSKKTGRGPLTSDWLQKEQGSVMCAYKRISVEFKYWGMQGKIEQFIHDGLRKPMLMGHRQAWVWQDEWYGLTINDIRELERETQRTLAQKMGNIYDAVVDEEERDSDTLAPLKNIKKAASAIELLSQESVDTDDNLTLERKQTPTFVFGEWRLGSLSKSDSEDEFFDANDEFDSDLSEEEDSEHLLQVAKRYDENSHSGESVDSLDSLGKDEDCDIGKKSVGKTLSSGSSGHSVNHLRVLVLVVHGGNPLDQSGDVKSKNNDCERLVREFENVLQNHYKEGIGRVVFRLVECPQVFKEALCALKDVETETPNCEEDTPSAPFQSTGFPLSSLPILAACSGDFRDMVDLTIARANEVYREFLNSEAGQNFNGEVCIVGDCIGGLLAYDAMSRQLRQNSFDTDLSGCSVPPSPVVKHTSNQTKADPFQDFTPYTGGVQNNNNGTSCGRSGSTNDADSNSRHSSTTDLGRSTYYDSIEDAEDWSKERSAIVIEGLEHLSLHDSQQSLFEPIKKFDFYITKFFAFGSPIGLVLLYKKFSQFEAHQGVPVKPYCGQFYNLFHPCDPLSSRIEPLILKEFSKIRPMAVPRYQKFPLGDGVCNDLTSWLNKLPRATPPKMKVERQQSNMSTTSAVSWDSCSMTDDWRLGVRNWWGTERLDYALYNPKNLHHLPQSVLCPLFHISYWESKDVVAFMIRELLDLNSTGEVTASHYRRERRQSSFYIPNPREKWRKKSTLYKIRNLTPNHRANDAIALEGAEQTITARFAYGPLDVATLSREKVDIYIMHYPPAGEWTLLDSCITGSNGRVSFTIPDEQKLEVGIYPVKMIARGDHTTVDSSLAVLPPKTEAVVFSIDGAFSASVSLRGRHPKVRPGAVDVVRHWQEKGYVIIYVTSRPAFQKHQVMSWMAEHNFPFGLVSFCGSLSTVDIQRHKSAYLRHLTNEVKVVIHAGYGSLKDVAVFAGVGVLQNAIFVIGKHSSKKHEKQATYLRDGYSSHLTSLANNPICKPASGNSRLTLRKDCFGLPAKQKHSTKRHGKHVK